MIELDFSNYYKSNNDNITTRISVPIYATDTYMALHAAGLLESLLGLNKT